MANKYSPNSISSLSEDWGKDVNDSLARPFSGQAVQDFLKSQINTKVGRVVYDETSNKYLMFASEETYQEYMEDPSKVDLLIASFDAPFNYTASIELTSKTYNSVFYGSTGNYIDFTFDVVNKAGQSTGENVTCTYTFIKGADKTVVNETYQYGQSVHKNIDSYLKEGNNIVRITITGSDSLAATTVSVNYTVVNLTLEDSMNISKVIDITAGDSMVEIPYSVYGYGTKVMEWYVDGVQQNMVKNEDEIVETSSTRTKYIDATGLSEGVHTLQIRVYLMSDGSKFYSNILYREFVVSRGTMDSEVCMVAATIPNDQGIVDSMNPLSLYGITQYVSYSFSFATYSPKAAASTTVEIKLDDDTLGTISSSNETVNDFSIFATTYGDKTFKLVLPNSTREIPVTVEQTSLDIKEITSSLSLAFDGKGKINNSTDKASWVYGEYKGTFTGFDWSNTSGWVDNCLLLSSGCSFGIDIAPLAKDAAITGKTLEFCLTAQNVSNDDVVVCDLTTNGVGVMLTASEVTVTSSSGKSITTKFSSGDEVRIAIVINRRSGTTNKGLVFIYVDGILSAAVNVLETEDFISSKQLLFTATKEADILLKQLRFYDTALTSDQILNNYILYQKDSTTMVEVYNRNDVYDEGGTTFSPDKMANRLPVMIITGDIPTLENTSNKNEQIVVDIDYTNVQDPTKNFRMEGAAMRPQGTSSMSYPKKNFRIYTKKVSGTVLYDYNGNVVEDKLYAFKDGAQPVQTWCLKADYAESSGTHNTGIARLWNDALYNARVDGEYLLRTDAQKAALENGYNYDVRTTVDGFPILVFYRLTANSELIFIGKYNFNNDKSTEKVYGFCDIPGFDNSNMECWEVSNNGNAIALFQTVADFDTAWEEAFEARYPDGSTDIAHLKAFCRWIVGANGKTDVFKKEKWEHMDVYKMAAYYVYLMRFGAVDQTVKNAMFTTEDGKHWFYINYDNDTINGVINTGELAANYDITRQSKGSDDAYIYAGHESVLWNMLEADDEFMTIVAKVDNALYSSGLKYSNVIDMFNNKQSGQWCERVYNQDAQYKYVGPYTNSGVNNLFMLQGSRSSHRKWWLGRRFDLFDSMFVSGEFKNKVLEFKLTNDTPAGQQFSITAGRDLYYGYGINDLATKTGVWLDHDTTYMFSTPRVLNLGDPVRVYSADNIKELNLSRLMDRINQLSFSTGGENLSCLETLTIGSTSKQNTGLSEISGLKLATRLKTLDITNCKGFTGLDLTGLTKMETLKANGSSLSSVIFEKGSNITTVYLPSSIQTLTFEQLYKLRSGYINMASWENTRSLTIKDCPYLSQDFSFVTKWFTNKKTDNSKCNLEINNIKWTNIDPSDIIALGAIKTAGGTLSLKGRITLTRIDEETTNQIKEIYGKNVFSSDSELWFSAPSDQMYIIGPSTVVEGDTAEFQAVVLSSSAGETTLEMSKSEQLSSDNVSFDAETGILTTKETGKNSGTLTITAKFVSYDQSVVVRTSKQVYIRTANYPNSLAITGDIQLKGEHTYTLTRKGNFDREGTTVWALSDTLIDNSVEIVSSSNTQLTIKANKLSDDVDGVITATIQKNTGVLGASTTKDVVILNPNIVISKKVNPTLMAAIYKTGLSENEGYMLKSEAAAVINSDFPKIPLGGVVTFDELQYFTGLTSITSANWPVALKSITFPMNVKTLQPFFSPSYSNALTHLAVDENSSYFYSQDNCIIETATNKLVWATPNSIIPKSVTSIGGKAFDNCPSLKSVSIPEGVTSIGSDAFYNCTSLTSINIPEGVTSIGSSAFGGCTSLTSINIPEGVTSIGSSAFGGCKVLNTIDLAAGNTHFSMDNGILYDIQKKTVLNALRNIKEAIFPEGVTSIGSGAFGGCTSLTSINIPEGVTSIGSSAFYNCTSLTSINIPEGVTSIGSSAFGGCTSLTSINIPEGVTSIEYGAFGGCVSLESVTLPSTLRSLSGHQQYNIFANCKKLTTFTCKATKAPNASNVFGNYTTAYMGRGNYDKGTNFLYVPAGATGYDSGEWLDPLQNSEKCGFTISYTL